MTPEILLTIAVPNLLFLGLLWAYGRWRKRMGW